VTLAVTLTITTVDDRADAANGRHASKLQLELLLSSLKVASLTLEEIPALTALSFA
jgi:hypothetical protein